MYKDSDMREFPLSVCTFVVRSSGSKKKKKTLVESVKFWQYVITP